MSTAKTMEEKVYDLMDWAAIEAVVYGEESRPDTILGAHIVPEGVLIQAFFPGAGSVSLKIHDKILPMICEDEAGYFAILLEGKKIPSYTYLVDDGDRMGSRFAGGYPDPYNFGSCFSEKELIRFRSGIWNKAYTRLGARLVERDGISGVQFAVWAPNAVRVSVVGDFNAWNGLSCQMVKNEAGIFELFLPGLTAGVLYKYEIKTKRGDVYLKADPFAHANEAKIEGASIVADMENYTWGDAAWLDSHREAQPEAPAVVYEVHLNSWRKKEDGSFLSYAEIAPLLTAYVRDMGYTHVELLPVMEYPDPASLGYGTQSFFAPTARLGKPEELKLLIDTLHQAGIGVILDWVPGFFARGKEGLSAFDGTCLYEHLNPKQGVHPMWNTLIFNYGRGEVRSFMSSSAFYWLEEFHADGLRINDVASMVYLDYGRAEGDWIANIYGGNENLETIAFLKELNAEVARQHPGAWMIAEEETGYPEVTGDPAKNGLGFTYKWNNGCLDDYIRYIELDPLFRGAHQDDLTFSMIYMYSERFFLSLSHDRMYKNRRTLLRQMPGGKDSTKLANLRLTLAYLMTYPGKILLREKTGIRKGRWPGRSWISPGTARHRSFAAISSGSTRRPRRCMPWMSIRRALSGSATWTVPEACWSICERQNKKTRRSWWSPISPTSIIQSLRSVCPLPDGTRRSSTATRCGTAEAGWSIRESSSAVQRRQMSGRIPSPSMCLLLA